VSFEVKLDPEHVNKVVAETIIKAALGQQLEKAIQKSLDDCVNGYNAPVKVLVSQHVNEAIRAVLDRDYREKIIAMIAEKLSKEHIDTIVEASVSKALDMLKSDRSSY
jgi:hypothetical protein